MTKRSDYLTQRVTGPVSDRSGFNNITKSNISSSLGMRNIYLMVIILMALLSTRICSEPSFLRVNKTTHPTTKTNLSNNRSQNLSPTLRLSRQNKLQKKNKNTHKNNKSKIIITRYIFDKIKYVCTKSNQHIWITYLKIQKKKKTKMKVYTHNILNFYIICFNRKSLRYYFIKNYT